MTTATAIPVLVLLAAGCAAADQSGVAFAASFREQQPAAGWSYLWNESGAIGSPDGYRPLLWAGKGYAPTATYPATGTPANYLLLGRGQGHPGVGANAVRDATDRFAIAAYAIPAGGAGAWKLVDGAIRRGAGGGTDGAVELRVYVGARQVLAKTVTATPEAVAFQAELGQLADGDRVYVAVGPAGNDVSDSFKLDYRLVRAQ